MMTEYERIALKQMNINNATLVALLVFQAANSGNLNLITNADEFADNVSEHIDEVKEIIKRESNKGNSFRNRCVQVNGNRRVQSRSIWSN